MELVTQTNKERWDAFVGSRPEAQFLQSWAWGDFQTALERPVVRLGVEKEGELCGVAQCVLRRHPFGVRSLSLYRGPLAGTAEAATMLLEAAEKKAAELGAAYVHVEPMMKLEKTGKRTGFDQVEKTLLLRLENDLLPTFHEKTRYNIRLAERKGVTVRRSTDMEDVLLFLELQRQTAKRDGIRVPGDAHYTRLVEVLGREGNARVFVAEYGGTPLAASIALSYGDTVTYLHGASSNEQRNLKAPHLLQWRQIEWAREQGKTWYDFWGIANTDDPAHPWAGITRFKKGFGGEMRTYPPAFDIPLAKTKYHLVRLRRHLRR